MWAPNKLRDFFINFDKSNPSHLEAVDILQKHAAPLMDDDAAWVKKFRDNAKKFVAPGECVSLIAKWEGFRSKPYLCPANVWTIGYGTTYYENGQLVQPTDSPITKDKALELLTNHINKVIIPTIGESIPTWHLMNANQKSAIISFAYNLGAHFYGGANFFSITRALSSKIYWSDVPRALRLYVNPGSSFESGLRSRREDEIALWMKPAG